MSLLLVFAVIASLLTASPPPCMASSDPFTSLCDPICWEEEALSDQCVQDRCSSITRVRSKAYRQCEDACWEMIVPCRRMCHDHSLSVLSRCERTCAPKAGMTTADTDCEWDCFTHNMMIIKARLLPRDYLHLKPN